MSTFGWRRVYAVDGQPSRGAREPNWTFGSRECFWEGQRASTSMIRLVPSMAPVTTMRMAAVVIGEKVTVRQTFRLPVTTAPGTDTQVVPLKYCTVNAVTPYLLKVRVEVG